MGFRDHGYYGYAFLATRPLQIVSLIAVIGMSANFVSDDARAGISAPSQILATLVISCLALLWSLVSFTAYDDTHFPYMVTAAVDGALTIPFIVVAGILGKPLPATTCYSLPVQSSTSAGGFLALPMGSRTSTNQNDYIIFVGDNQTTCYAIMATWGLVIALCILFALSAIAIGLLILGQRRAAAMRNGAGGGGGAMGAGTGAYPATTYPPNESQIEMARAPAKEMSDGESMNSFDDNEYDNYDEQQHHGAMGHDGPGSPASPAYSHDGYGEHDGYDEHDAYPPHGHGHDDDDGGDGHATHGHQQHRFDDYDDEDDDATQAGDDGNRWNDHNSNGQTTPLSPPPHDHQLRASLAYSSSVESNSPYPVSPSSPLDDVRRGIIPIVFSPQIVTSPRPPAAAAASASAAVVCDSPVAMSFTTAPSPPSPPRSLTARTLTNTQPSTLRVPPPPLETRPTWRKGESRFREARESMWQRSPLSGFFGGGGDAGFEDVPPTPPPAQDKPPTRRKTILERVEGWWDLGLTSAVRGKTVPFPVKRKDTAAAAASASASASASDHQASFV